MQIYLLGAYASCRFNYELIQAEPPELYPPRMPLVLSTRMSQHARYLAFGIKLTAMNNGRGGGIASSVVES